MWRTMKILTECARSAMVLDGEISKYVDILLGVTQRRTLLPNRFKIYIYIYIYILQPGIYYLYMYNIMYILTT